MRIVEDKGMWHKTVEYEYTPTPEEAYWYYSGTHAGLNRNNPYAKRYGMSVTRTRYTLAPPKKGNSK